MKKSRLVVLMTALAVMSALVLAACGGDDDKSSDSGNTSASGSFSSELVSEGTLTVGSDIPYAPFEFGKAPDYEGFDVDLVNEIADRLDLEVSIKDTSFDTIFTDVASGKFDLVASAASITPEREQTVNFSDPYYESEQALLVPEGSDIKTVDDLSGLTVGAQDGTTGEAYANDETDAGQVRGFPTGPAAIAALTNGQVEATIIDNPVAADAIEKGQKGFEIAQVIPTGEFYGFALSKNTPELLTAVNGALSEIKSDGTLDKLFEEWFNTKAPASLTKDAGSADTGTTE